MKNAIKKLWNGIKAVFTAIIDWFATLFGMKAETKYARVVRGIVSAAFAILVVVWAVGGLYDLGRTLHWRISRLFDTADEEYRSVEHLSENLTYYESYDPCGGYLRNGKHRKVLKGIEWIAMPMPGDSLVCFSDGNHRGYFHLRDGRVVVKPKYQHAWVFSEGLAAVDENGFVKFINPQGEVAIHWMFGYNEDDFGYVFHNGRCAVREGVSGKMGLIDRTGEWVLQPEYDNINMEDSFLQLCVGKQQAILTYALDTVIPMTAAEFFICDSAIYAIYSDHTQRVYSLQGELLAASQIRSVKPMLYETREVMYPSNKDGDECDEPYYYINPVQRQEVATCLRYEGEMDWYGLMSPDGKALTPPMYTEITAVDKDLYLCKTTYDRGVMLNSKGEPVE